GVVTRFAPGATGQSQDNTRRTFIGADGFVGKMNASGGAVLYSTFLGGNGEDAATSIAIDSTGRAYITGSTLSTNFPTTGDAQQTAFKGGGVARTAVGDAFFARLSPTGSALDFSTYL